MNRFIWRWGKKIKVKFSKDINQNGLFNIHIAVCFTPAGFLFCFSLFCPIHLCHVSWRLTICWCCQSPADPWGGLPASRGFSSECLEQATTGKCSLSAGLRGWSRPGGASSSYSHSPTCTCPLAKPHQEPGKGAVPIGMAQPVSESLRKQWLRHLAPKGRSRGTAHQWLPNSSHLWVQQLKV